MKRPLRILGLFTLSLLLILLIAQISHADAEAGSQVVAFDMVGSASQNLISFTDDPAIPFTSLGDGFQKFQRGVSASIPFAVLDDSLITFPSDTQGIIDDLNLDEFFGIVDTNNGDTGGSDVVATWVFDVSGASNLSLSIDTGAMGDFEVANDFFEWSYSIDGSAEQTVFQSSVDETIAQTYTLAGGAEITLDDPLLVNGALLDNVLQTQTAALTGTGDELTLTLTANFDGGSEAVAFQDIVITGDEAPAVIAFDMVNSASQNLISFTDDPAIPFTSAGDGFQKYQRGVSPSIPFAVLDDSLITFPADTQGIIDDLNLDEFFGIVDTNNGDTGGNDVVAAWVFDVSGASNLSLSIDAGAMGDFEVANDFFDWSYSIDGGAAQTAFQSSVDETIAQTYTLAGGAEITLDDPLLVNGVLLDNVMQKQTVAMAGTGNQLSLVLTANFDGGSEAVAFQNLIIEGVGGVVNLPPIVASTVPTDGAEYVAIDDNIEIVFSEPVTTTGSWFEIACDSTPVPAVDSGGPTSYTLDPVSDLPDSTPCTVTILARQVADLGDPPLNMVEDYSFGFTTSDLCGDPATLIHEVQGPGTISPIVGQIVTIEGVVVGDFQESDELNGFFVQEEDADFDGDPNSSEGVFVYEGGFVAPDVNEGDLVRVTGEVDEYKTLTQLTNIANVLACDYAPGPYGPVDVILPEATDGDLETVEGMNVTVTNTMSVAQNYFLGRYGQLTLSSDLTNRLYQPTNQVLPNTPQSAALADYNARNLLFLDDGVDVSRCGDNPVPVPYLGPAPPAVLRGGDHVTSLTGVLDYGQINSAACSNSATLEGRDYRLHPTQAPVFSIQNPRTAAPADVGGSLTVVSFNVLNFFNGDGLGGGFPTSRGADTYDEFVRQRIKIFEAMVAIDGDIVGLMEIENDGYDQYSAIAELVKVLNEGPCYDTTLCSSMGYTGTGLGTGTYAYIDAGPGTIGTDEITVGYIYKPASVTPFGNPVVIDETAFTDPNNYGSQKNRPAVVQTFSDNNGGIFTAIVNHLKSKGSSCGPGDDDPEQASCNTTRTLAAEYLVDTVVPAVQAASGDADVMILGDLNAYAMEDPIRALTDGGFTNLLSAFNGPYGYSYTFDGMVGYLDHSLANSSLSQQVTGVTTWHINTDEPAVIDYDENFNPPGYYSPDPYRASDHDPVVAGIMLSHVTASFTSNSPVVVGDLSVFTNTTAGGGLTDYEWNFGDGSPVVTDTNPTYLYTAEGIYTVVLTATDAGGSDVFADQFVVFPAAPEASFTSNSPVVVGNLSEFTNSTTGGGTLAYEWNFGDGTPIVTATNPTHLYAAEGTYTVVLTATNLGGSDVFSDQHMVVPPAAIASFTSNSPVVVGVLAIFTNTSSGTAPITYEWNFGDGSAVVTDTNPTHMYTSAGTYTVVLTATNLGGSDAYTDTFDVQAPTDVVLSDFSGENRADQWLWIISLALFASLAGFVLFQRRRLRMRV